MNPFSLCKKYDSNLAEILSRTNRAVSVEPLRELLEYIPQVDVEADIQIIFKTLISKFESNYKPIVNKILYKILSKLRKHTLINNDGLFNTAVPAGGSTLSYLDIHIGTIEIPWIYHNFDSKDPYAIKLFESYFDVKKVAKELGAYLKWNDPIRDLSCFLFIMDNSNDQHYFDVRKLELCTYFEFDSLYKILSIIKKNFPVEIKKISSMSLDCDSSEEKYVKTAKESFEVVRNVQNTLFLNKKYRILLDIYDFIDDSVYSEARYLDCETLKRVCNKNIVCERLELASLDQIEVAVAKISNTTSKNDLDDFVIKNINNSMCLFQIIEKTGLSTSFILNNEKVFAPLANKTLKMHFITKICSCTTKSLEYISDLESIFTGKYQITVAAVLNRRMTVEDINIKRSEDVFTKKDIEELMDFCVKVFPKSYFLENSFDASIVPLLKEYPSLLDDCLLSNSPQWNAKNLLANFKNTKVDEVVKLIKKLETLLLFFETLTQEEIYCIYKKQKNIPEHLKIVYLFYLRSLMLVPDSKDKHYLDHFKVDYGQVFSLFLDTNFLKFLLISKNNLAGFTACVLNYIKEMSIPISILYYGYNFDHNSKIVKNLDVSSIPQKDKVLAIIRDVLEHVFFCKQDNSFVSYLQKAANGQDSSSEKIELFFIEIMYNLIRIILFEEMSSCMKSLKKYDNLIKTHYLSRECKEATLREALETKFDLGKNNFILERFLQEAFDAQHLRISKSVLILNKFKEIDIILRNARINPNYLLSIDPSLLSIPALKNVVSSLIMNANNKEFSVLSDLVIYNDINENLQVCQMNESNQALSSIESTSALDSTSSDISTITSKISNVNLRESEKTLENYDFLRLFTKQDTKSILDFLFLIENDNLLYSEDFREERISVYWELINLFASHLSKDFINLYSFSKLESDSQDDVVLDLILSPLINYTRSFWTLLSATLHKTSNIYISIFFEKMISCGLDTQKDSCFLEGGIQPLHDYLISCSKRELNLFCFVFPNVCLRMDMNDKKLEFKELLREMVEFKIDNGKLTFSETNEFYSLRFVYRVDSIDHIAVINVPICYPSKPARIEFDHKKAKNTKFYYKLNELIKKTSKFFEIFLLWKVDIDNHIAGYTECMICYYIMEPKYRTLPGFKCHNCSNIYHDKCVYKWFSESKNKQCPFCRVPMEI